MEQEQEQECRDQTQDERRCQEDADEFWEPILRAAWWA